jgi:hypothetical protein
MTVMVAAEEKLNDVQETKIGNPLVGENTNKKNKVHWSDYREVCICVQVRHIVYRKSH